MPDVYAIKFLKPGATGPHSGFKWPVPNGRPGRWVHVKGELVACENGVHACGPKHLMRWISDEAWLVELGGRVFEHEGDKLVARRGRLVRQLDWSARLFAADCAERVLPIFERAHAGDDRPRKAIVAARAFERGEITSTQLAAALAAAKASTRDAARPAVWDAARAAGRAAAWDAARDAAWAAARAAAGAAAGAARAAAWDAEREWQLPHLLGSLGLSVGEREGLWDA